MKTMAVSEGTGFQSNSFDKQTGFGLRRQVGRVEAERHHERDVAGQLSKSQREREMPTVEAVQQQTWHQERT